MIPKASIILSDDQTEETAERRDHVFTSESSKSSRKGKKRTRSTLDNIETELGMNDLSAEATGEQQNSKSQKRARKNQKKPRTEQVAEPSTRPGRALRIAVHSSVSSSMPTAYTDFASDAASWPSTAETLIDGESNSECHRKLFTLNQDEVSSTTFTLASSPY